MLTATLYWTFVCARCWAEIFIYISICISHDSTKILLLISPFSRWGNTGTERLRRLRIHVPVSLIWPRFLSFFDLTSPVWVFMPGADHIDIHTLTGAPMEPPSHEASTLARSSFTGREKGLFREGSFVFFFQFFGIFYTIMLYMNYFYIYINIYICVCIYTYAGNLYIFYFLFLYFSLTRTSSMTLNRNGDGGHCVLFSDLRGNLVSYHFVRRFSVDGLYQMEEVPSVPSFLRLFLKSWVGVEFCQILSLPLLIRSCDFSPLAHWCGGLY